MNNSVLLLALSCLLHVIHSQEDPCDNQLPFENGGVCLPIGDLCCECFGSGCEGCVTVDCPTTDAPVTTTSAPETTTSVPETTNIIGTTLTGKPCTCTTQNVPDSDPECPPSTDESDGDECDCSGGMVELRFNYTGTDSNVEISLYDESDTTQPICTFTNVNPKDEIICNINDDSPVVIQTGLSKFPKNTRFIITRNDASTCGATYHTSCSKNIVGVVMDECDELVASGWRDGDGDNCESDYIGSSNSRSGSGSRDGDNDDECDCHGGIVELRFNYTGTDTNVAISLSDAKSSETICNFVDVNPKDEIICNVLVTSAVLVQSGLSKFPTNTAFTIERNDASTCSATYHTSCSQNIVGVVQDECDELVVSGWRDGDGSNCQRDYVDSDDESSAYDPCKSRSRSRSKSSSSRHRMVRRLKGSKSASKSGKSPSKSGSKSASKSGSKSASKSGSKSGSSSVDDDECICGSESSESKESSSSKSKGSSRGSKKKSSSSSSRRSDSTGSVSHGKKKKSSSSSSSGSARYVAKSKGGGSTQYSGGIDQNDDDDNNNANMVVNDRESLGNGGDMLTDGGVSIKIMNTWMIAVFGAFYVFIF